MKSIIKEGYYSFCIDPEQSLCSLKLHVNSLKKDWSEEEVSDFVRRLGFVDISKEYGEQFLYVNEVGLLYIMLSMTYFCDGYDRNSMNIQISVCIVLHSVKNVIRN